MNMFDCIDILLLTSRPECFVNMFVGTLLEAGRAHPHVDETPARVAGTRMTSQRLGAPDISLGFPGKFRQAQSGPSRG